MNSPDKGNSFQDKQKEFGKKAAERLKAAMDWAVQNKKVSVPAAAFLVVALLVIVAGMSGKGTDAQTGAQADGKLPVIPVPEVALEENAHPEVNKLMDEYFAALADGDMEKLLSLKNYIEETEQIRIEKKSKYIEKYENIVCYTKAGLSEDSYLVYVYCEAKFYDIENPAPALYTFVVFKNEAGEYYIYEGELDDNVVEYLKGLSAQDDVTNLCNIVEAKYNEAMDSDEILKAFMDEFPALIKKEQGEELAAREMQDGETKEETEDTEETEGTEEPVESTPAVKEVETIDTVNVRSSDSEIADKLGKAEAGTRLPLLEKKENGWTKVEFEGQEAFIKSEYLADVVTPEGEEDSQEPGEAEDAQADESAESTRTESETGTSGGGLVGSDGKVRATTTVNVRASANENGEKLGVVYEGETLELIMQQADGWCKVKYNGKTGYIKTEFVE